MSIEAVEAKIISKKVRTEMSPTALPQLVHLAARHSSGVKLIVYENRIEAKHWKTVVRKIIVEPLEK